MKWSPSFSGTAFQDFVCELPNEAIFRLFHFGGSGEFLELVRRYGDAFVPIVPDKLSEKLFQAALTAVQSERHGHIKCSVVREARQMIGLAIDSAEANRRVNSTKFSDSSQLERTNSISLMIVKRGRLYTLVRRKTNRVHDIEDACQESWIELSFSPNEFPQNFDGFLKTIARRQHFDLTKGKKSSSFARGTGKVRTKKYKSYRNRCDARVHVPLPGHPDYDPGEAATGRNEIGIMRATRDLRVADESVVSEDQGSVVFAVPNGARQMDLAIDLQATLPTLPLEQNLVMRGCLQELTQQQAARVIGQSQSAISKTKTKASGVLADLLKAYQFYGSVDTSPEKERNLFPEFNGVRMTPWQWAAFESANSERPHAAEPAIPAAGPRPVGPMLRIDRPHSRVRKPAMYSVGMVRCFAAFARHGISRGAQVVPCRPAIIRAARDEFGKLSPDVIRHSVAYVDWLLAS